MFLQFEKPFKATGAKSSVGGKDPFKKDIYVGFFKSLILLSFTHFHETKLVCSSLFLIKACIKN